GSSRPSGNIVLLIATGSLLQLVITDNAYGQPTIRKQVNRKAAIVLNLEKSQRWYDFTITARDYPAFSKRYAGRVETGEAGISDPAMG
ncbi:MAG: DUF756 domain-containing protein, partial [Bacteroidota bacterium]|nr:DUF756 domain-containing protein [Bacteroidota bacterium]